MWKLVRHAWRGVGERFDEDADDSHGPRRTEISQVARYSPPPVIARCALLRVSLVDWLAVPRATRCSGGGVGGGAVATAAHVVARSAHVATAFGEAADCYRAGLEQAPGDLTDRQLKRAVPMESADFGRFGEALSAPCDVRAWPLAERASVGIARSRAIKKKGR